MGEFIFRLSANAIAVEEGNHGLFNCVLVCTFKCHQCNDHIALIVERNR
jgi:hypothetical protein